MNHNPLESLISFFFPKTCPLCHSETEENSHFCTICRRNLDDQMAPSARSIGGALTTINACGEFTPELRTIIHLLKYKMFPGPAQELLSVGISRMLLPPINQIVPVPLHWRRRASRGYNQAMLLAKSAGGILMATPEEKLRRTRYSDTQTKRGRSERRRNVAHLFEPKQDEIVGRSILLIDDVCTTGATAQGCAEALVRAGAESVHLLVLAQA